MTKEFKVGIYIVLAIVILYWGINFLKGNDIFASSRVYYAIYDNTEGLTPAVSVAINGKQVGVIDDIYFHPDQSGRLVVRLKMQMDYPLPSDSKAKIHSSGLLGERNIQLMLGDSTTLAQDGDTLFATVEGSLTDAVNEQVAPIKAKAENLLASLDTAVTLLTGFLDDETRDNFRKSFASLQRTFTRLDQSSAILARYLEENEGNFDRFAQNLASITDNLKNNNENITMVLSNLNAITDSIQRANITGTFNKVNHAMTQLDSSLTKINNGQGTIGQLVNNPELYDNLEDAASSLNRLLLDIKYNPNKYVHFSMFGSKRTYNDQDIEEMEEELKRAKEQQAEEEKDKDKNRN